MGTCALDNTVNLFSAAAGTPRTGVFSTSRSCGSCRGLSGSWLGYSCLWSRFPGSILCCVEGWTVIVIPQQGNPHTCIAFQEKKKKNLFRLLITHAYVCTHSFKTKSITIHTDFCSPILERRWCHSQLGQGKRAHTWACQRPQRHSVAEPGTQSCFWVQLQSPVHCINLYTTTVFYFAEHMKLSGMSARMLRYSDGVPDVHSTD